MLHDRFLMTESKKPLTILLASPRGFRAGVDRAIHIVERAIERYDVSVEEVRSTDESVVFKLPRQLVA